MVYRLPSLQSGKALLQQYNGCISGDHNAAMVDSARFDHYRAVAEILALYRNACCRIIFPLRIFGYMKCLSLGSRLI
jgi:hypothetical protein